MKKILVMEDESNIRSFAAMSRLKLPPAPKLWKRSRPIPISVWRFSTSCCLI